MNAAADRMQRSALRYAALGWRVFPLRAGTKRPATENGFHDGTTDPEAIRRAFPPGTRYNLGATPPPDLIALDLDVKDGDDGPAALRSLDLATPATAVQTTPSGGRHLIYRLPAGVDGWESQGDIAPGVDTRASGKGYIVLAPSIVGGAAYRWKVAPTAEHIAPAPEWLVNYCRRKVAAAIDAPEIEVDARELTPNDRAFLAVAIDLDPHVRELYAGRWQWLAARRAAERKGCSASEADASLAARLLRLGASPARVQRIMRSSALRRAKYDDRRGKTTYLAHTVARIARLVAREEATV